jgi:hypothetical protein
MSELGSKADTLLRPQHDTRMDDQSVGSIGETISPNPINRSMARTALRVSLGYSRVPRSTAERQTTGRRRIMKRLGNCYAAAFRAFLDGNRLHDLLKQKRVLSKAKLVHGLVDGEGPARGTRYGHAWVEANGIAYDFSNRRNRRELIGFVHTWS